MTIYLPSSGYIHNPPKKISKRDDLTRDLHRCGVEFQELVYLEISLPPLLEEEFNYHWNELEAVQVFLVVGQQSNSKESSLEQSLLKLVVSFLHLQLVMLVEITSAYHQLLFMISCFFSSKNDGIIKEGYC